MFFLYNFPDLCMQAGQLFYFFFSKKYRKYEMWSYYSTQKSVSNYYAGFQNELRATCDIFQLWPIIPKETQVACSEKAITYKHKHKSQSLQQVECYWDKKNLHHKTSLANSGSPLCGP